MWLAADHFGKITVAGVIEGPRPAETGMREVGLREDAGRETWMQIGVAANRIVGTIWRRRMESRALAAYIEGKVYADAFRQLVMLVLARDPQMKSTIQEIEQESLERVATLAAMPISGAEQISEIMDTVRSNVAATWSGTTRPVATRAVEPPTPGGMAPRRRGRPAMAAE